MKTSFIHVSLALAWICCPVLAGPEEEPVRPQHVRVQTSHYEVSQKALAQALANLQPRKESLYQAIKRLTKQGNAKLLNTALTVCMPGKKTTTESIREVIYPAEYEPPELPGTFGSQGPRRIDGNHSTSPLLKIPTAFETRNVGETLTVQASISSPGKHIDLRLEQETSTHPRDHIWLERKGKRGKNRIIFPEFDTQRTTSQVRLRSKQSRLISTFTPHNKEGQTDCSRKILVFVKATLITPHQTHP